jgi:signal transduction histidine kinase
MHVAVRRLLHLEVKMSPIRIPVEALVRVEFLTAKRAVIASAFQIVGYACFRWLLAVTPSLPPATDIVGTVIIGAMTARTCMWLVQRRTYAKPRGRERWLAIFRAWFWLGGLAWGVLAALCLAHYGLTYPTFIAVLLDVGICAASSAVLLGVDLVLVRGFIPLIMGPIAVVTFVQSDRPGYVALGILLVLFAGYMFLVAANSHRLVVEAMRSRHVEQMQREQLVALIDAMPGYVMWTDLEGRVLGMNQRLAAAGDEMRVFDDLIEEFVASAKTQDVIERAVGSAGKARTHVIAMLRRDTAEGQQIILSALDVEAQKLAERQVHAAAAKSEESARLAAVGTLAIGIAHEINNPLQILNNLVSLWRMYASQPDPLQQKLLDKMDRALGRLSTIVAGMRSLGRDPRAAVIAPVKLKPLVDEVVEIVRTSGRSDDVPIQIGPIDDDLTIECRDAEIGQVLLNLLLNAQDAVRCLPERWIHLDVVDLGELVELSVTDSGSGIPRDIADKIMLPFFTTKTGTGTGLGLSISRSIIERHGGTLAVDRSAPHTRFVVRLPKTAEATAIPTPHPALEREVA